MCTQLLDSVVFPLEFLFGKQLVNLQMTRPANAGYLPNEFPSELAFIALVVVARARDEVMPREPFFAAADRAAANHT
jgi:hypothetical protein